MIDNDLWWTGGANGSVYRTKDTGTTWAEKSFNGSGSGVVYDIVFPTRSIGYISHSTATPSGRLLRTYSGGNSWVVQPDRMM